MATLPLAVYMGCSLAESNTYNFNIPAQSLGSALSAVSKQTGLQPFYADEAVAGKHSPALKGTYSKQQAVEKLLAGSGLTYSFTGNNSVALKANPAKPESKNESSVKTLQTVTVTDNNFKDPYNQDYTLPNATSGTKTDTPIMETPLNVQVISKQVMKDQQVIELNQALKNVSGVTMTKAASGALVDKLFLRGFATNTLFRNGFRMDDANSNIGLGQQFANVESIEVLKGPAAILYGRVEPGGMVNIITKQPLATPYYALNQQFGSYSLFRTTVDATGPLTKDDTLLYRFNASFQDNKSFRDLLANEDVFLASVLKWNISPRTQVTLEMEYQHQKTNLDQQILPFDQNTQRFTELPHSRNLLERNPLENEHIFAGLNWSHQFNDDWSIKHQVNYKRQFINLGTSYFAAENEVDPSDHIDRFASTRHNNTLETVATNLDLTGHFKTWGLEHTLLFGGDYYRFDAGLNFANSDSFSSGIYSPINIDNPVHPGPSLPIDPTSNFTTKSGSDNYGLYAQDQITLPYNVHVMGGIRYQNVHSTSKSAGADGVYTTNTPQTDDAVTPRVGLLWQPQKWLSLYSNYAENFGANTGKFAFGGLDSAGNELASTSLKPQTAQQWEVGAKTEFLDGRMRASLAYFDLTKQNVATTDIAHQFDCGGAGCSRAVGEARSKGIELDIQGEILPGWKVIGNYANINARVTKSTNPAGTDFNGFEVGNRLEFVPRNIGSVWSSYEVQQGALQGFKIGGGVNLQDSVVSANNAIKSTGYGLVNLMTGYSIKASKSKINLQLNIDNLLDKSYYTNGVNYGSNIGYVTLSTPRTFMGSIGIQF
jgi:iron complex outermembrane receptor protein